MRLLVDANGLLYRSYHAFDLSTARGRQVGGVFGFLRGVERLLTEIDEVDEVTFFWDGGHSKRSAIYPEYKSNRKRDPEVVEQVTWQRATVVHLLALLPVTQVWVHDVEADDAIGIVSGFTRLEDVGIVTHDHDLYQLATDKHPIFDFNGKQVELAGKSSHHLTLKVLIGDTSDNIKGISRVGEVTAAKLLREHKTLRGIMREAKRQGKLGSMPYAEARSVIKRNLELMKIGHLVTDVERASVLDQYRWGRQRQVLDEKLLRSKFMEFEFTSIVSRLSGFLAPFKMMVRDAKSSEADGKARRYEQRVCEAFKEGGQPDSERGFARRVRNVVGGVSTIERGAASRRGEGRRPPTSFIRRVRKEASVGAATHSARQSPPRALRAGDGAGGVAVGAKRSKVAARSGRAGALLAGLLSTPEAVEKRRLRRREALSILSSFEEGEGWEWLRRRALADLTFVSTMIRALGESDEYAPNAAAMREIKRVHHEYTMAMPDWMGTDG